MPRSVTKPAAGPVLPMRPAAMSRRQQIMAPSRCSRQVTSSRFNQRRADPFARTQHRAIEKCSWNGAARRINHHGPMSVASLCRSLRRYGRQRSQHMAVGIGLPPATAGLAPAERSLGSYLAGRFNFPISRFLGIASK